MNSDIKDISPVEDVITFSDKSGNVYTLPGKVPSYLSLVMTDMWDGLAPFIQIMGTQGKARRDIIKKFGEDQKKDPLSILKETDLAAREIMAMLASEKYPHIDAEWIEQNIPDDQYHFLALEILQKGTSFFLSRAKNSEHLVQATADLQAQTKRLGLG